jgi:D-alanine--D-alanine ligase
MLNILLLCGGKGNERDISINSVRSVYDHIKGLGTIIPTVVFFDADEQKYLIDERYLYSNTSDDFRFLLKSSVSPMTESEYNIHLSNCDFVFPVIHGIGGEDGKIQHYLDERNIKYIGSPSAACAKMYNKRNANDQILVVKQLPNIPKIFISSVTDETEAAIREFVSLHGAICIKPVEGGSSFGVKFAAAADLAVEAAKQLLKEYNETVIEQKCTGKEFTIIILDNNGTPVALMPTEIEVNGTFDRRRKYMSTTEVRYHCPARFDDGVINKIRSEAEELFSFTGARDFLRIDGWILDNGDVYFSDFNPISGMEQNSFIFQQAAKIGFTHGTLLEYIIRNTCKRYSVPYPDTQASVKNSRRVNILLGGITSERQVSLLSGTNVWMKLLYSEKYTPVPYILTKDVNNDTWIVSEIPYSFALLHTTEEIIDQINSSKINDNLICAIRRQLGLARQEMNSNAKSTWIGLNDFLEASKMQGAYVFVGLHGGFGENGGIQSVLDEKGVDYNGSGVEASALCMDKYKTGMKVTELNLPQLRTCKKVLGGLNSIWEELVRELGEPIIAKPNGDGCSTGIVKLGNSNELTKYLEFCRKGEPIPKGTFENQPETIAMPAVCESILFEEYIKTDSVLVEEGKVKYRCDTGWIEITIGVLEKKGQYHSFNPSIAIAENAILTVEEKFQGGVGINLTPPPEDIISAALKDRIKYFAECVAEECGIEDYCRIDMFANNKTEEVIVIEINTLPGLSPSTVLFQQAAKETPSLSPCGLLERIVDSRGCF